MCAGTLNDTDTPTFEVRVYRENRLVVRECCGSREEATAIAEHARPQDHVYLLVHDGGPDLGPGDVVTPKGHRRRSDGDEPLASRKLPGYGTE